MSDASPSKVIFLHSPKTGGTTFRGVLQRVYPRLGMCSDPALSVLRAELAAHDALEVLTAGAPGGGTRFANEELMQEEGWDVLRGAEVFVMFREPAAFTVSLFHHIVRYRDAPRVQGTYAGEPGNVPVDFDAFIADPRHANVQLSFLVGNLPFHSGRVTDRSDLEHGLRVLEELGLHVGVTERFQDFLHVFENVTGRVIPGRRVERRNVNPDGEDPRIRDPAVRQRIADANPLDRELYARAAAIAARQAEACGPRPEYVFVDADDGV